jgi:hypothetical protein
MGSVAEQNGLKKQHSFSQKNRPESDSDKTHSQIEPKTDIDIPHTI